MAGCRPPAVPPSLTRRTAGAGAAHSIRVRFYSPQRRLSAIYPVCAAFFRCSEVISGSVPALGSHRPQIARAG